MIEYAGYILLTAGALFIFLAVVSLMRFSDIYARTNSFTKLAFFGILLLTGGSIAMCGFSAVGIKALLLFAIVLATLPYEARLILKTASVNGVKMSHEARSGTEPTSDEKVSGK